MLKNEINNLFKRTEREIIEFVTFIKDMEKEHKNILPGVESGYKYNMPKEDRTSQQPVSEDSEENNALFDAFVIVNSVLTRLSILTEEFASVVFADEERPRSTLILNRYYLQYVNEIILYLLNVIVENLATFSERLSSLYSSEHKCDSLSSAGEKVYPLSSKIKHFKPSPLLSHDDPKCKSHQLKRHKCETKSSLHSSGSGTSSNSDEEIRRKASKIAKYKTDDSTNDIFRGVIDVLKFLVYTLEKVLRELKESIRNHHEQTRQYMVIPEIAKNISSEIKLQCLCPQGCPLCCKSCRYLHEKHKYVVSLF